MCLGWILIRRRSQIFHAGTNILDGEAPYNSTANLFQENKIDAVPFALFVFLQGVPHQIYIHLYLGRQRQVL